MSVALDASQRKQIERRRQQTRDYRLAMRLSNRGRSAVESVRSFKSAASVWPLTSFMVK
jgi:hypothetical protein